MRTLPTEEGNIMMQHATYWYEPSEKQSQATTGRQAANLAYDIAPQQAKEKRILGLSEEEIAKIILVITASSWVGWLLSALWPVSATF
jgi:hypothetical protein